jgi:hypothetical protein
MAWCATGAAACDESVGVAEDVPEDVAPAAALAAIGELTGALT